MRWFHLKILKSIVSEFWTRPHVTMPTWFNATWLFDFQLRLKKKTYSIFKFALLRYLLFICLFLIRDKSLTSSSYSGTVKGFDPLTHIFPMNLILFSVFSFTTSRRLSPNDIRIFWRSRHIAPLFTCPHLFLYGFIEIWSPT